MLLILVKLRQVFERLSTSVRHPALQRSLIAIIPDSAGLLRHWKRRLALAFFLAIPAILDFNFDESELLTGKIVARLRDDEQFRVREHAVHYGDLAALILLLDVGIGGGFNSTITHVQNPSTPEAKEAVKAFNADVDKLSDEVKRVFTRITDGGASHMERTEAKTVLERLLYRLEWSVRTKARPKTKLFVDAMEARGLDVGDSAKSHFMERFLKLRPPLGVSE